MQIENMTTEVRPRIPWESIDLGFNMVQTWWRPIYTVWFTVVLPIALLLNLLLMDMPWLAGLIIWWLKPLFDRIPLHIISHAVFGEIPTWRESMRALPKILRPNIIKALTLYRLDPARSFNLPVWQLEGMKGRQRKERARVLQRFTHDTAIKLTIVCIHLEVVILLSLFGLLYMMLPESLSSSFLGNYFDNQDAWWATVLTNGFALAAISAIEPFYVAGGFALYLNRRTHLEAWDIELAFRRLAQRIRPTQAVASLIVITLSCSLLIGGLSLTPTTSYAATSNPVTTPTTISNKEAKKIITEILAAKEFQTKREKEGWYLKDKEKEKEIEEYDGFLSWFAFAKDIGQAIAQLGEFFLWVLVFILIVLLITYYRRWLPFFSQGAKKNINKQNPPDVLMGLDVRPDSLPDDVAQTAWGFWQQGNPIAALSLLYRGTLSTLINRDGMKLGQSATEGDCLRIVRQYKGQDNNATNPDVVNYFQRLTLAWQMVAYAKRSPSDREAKDLCHAWTTHFGINK